VVAWKQIQNRKVEKQGRISEEGTGAEVLTHLRAALSSTFIVRHSFPVVDFIHDNIPQRAEAVHCNGIHFVVVATLSIMRVTNR
jgi:hypothetical protein